MVVGAPARRGYAWMVEEWVPSPGLRGEMSGLVNDVVTAEIVGALNAAGIRNILLKGPSIARWIYDEGERGPSGDVDVLVSPDQLAEAETVAARLGFIHLDFGPVPLEPLSHHSVWVRESDGACLELHRTFFGVTVSRGALWRELESETESLVLAPSEQRAEVLSAHARGLMLALHAAAHGPTDGRPLNDLRRGIERLPPATWDGAATLAVRLGAQRTFVLGLLLVPEGEAIVDQTGLPKDETVETVLRAANQPTMALGFEWLAQSRGVRRKVALLLGELAPPPDFMRLNYLVARRGKVGLAAAYAARPFRLAVQAPRAFRAWRDAKRHVAAGSRR